MHRLWLLVLLGALPCRAATLYVAPDGRDGATGAAEQPLARVQAALDRAKAGDTVWLRAGVYRERVTFRASGEHGRPVTLTGDAGAVLDGADQVALDWRQADDVAPGVWRAKVPGEVFTLTADAKIVTMLRENRVDPQTTKDPAWQWPTIFRQGILPSGWDGVKALAMYRPKAKEVLLRLRGDLDPRTLPITVAPRQPVVLIQGVDRCVVRGLALRNAAYGVLARDSIGSVVEQCRLGPVDYGVWLDAGTDRCTVRANEIFMAPYAGADPHQRPGSWDNWKAHKTGGHYDRYGVQIRGSIGGHEVHDNDIHDTWDGIEDHGGSGQNVGLRIHHNRIFNVSDDGLEPNGAEVDCRWHDNLVRRSICGFRIKAPTMGPLYAWRNFFLENGEDFRNYGEVELKPATVYVYHNTCTARVAVQSNKVAGIGTPRYHYFSNLFWCRYWWGSTGDCVQPNWKGDHNVYVRRDEDERWQPGRDLAAKLGLDARSVWLTGEPGFRDLAAGDLSLKPDSPALGRGAHLAALLGRELPGLPPVGAQPPAAGALQPGEPMPVLPRRGAAVLDPPAGTWPGPEARRGQALDGPNLLPDGGFEQGLAAWGKVDARVYALAEGGFESARFLRVTAAGRASDLGRVLGDLQPGRTYLLAYHSRASTIADLRIIVRDPATAQYLVTGRPEQGAEWQRTVLRFAAPGPSVKIEISPRAAGSADLDGFGLYLVP